MAGLMEFWKGVLVWAESLRRNGLLAVEHSRTQQGAQDGGAGGAGGDGAREPGSEGGRWMDGTRLRSLLSPSCRHVATLLLRRIIACVGLSDMPAGLEEGTDIVVLAVQPERWVRRPPRRVVSVCFSTARHGDQREGWRSSDPPFHRRHRHIGLATWTHCLPIGHHAAPA